MQSSRMHNALSSLRRGPSQSTSEKEPVRGLSKKTTAKSRGKRIANDNDTNEDINDRGAIPPPKKTKKRKAVPIQSTPIEIDEYSHHGYSGVVS